MSGRTLKAVVGLLVVLAAVGWDQGTKHAARAGLEGKPPVFLVDRVLVLRYVENEGAFLSLGARLPRPVRTVIFIAFPLVILGIMVVYLLRKGGIPWGTLVGVLPHRRRRRWETSLTACCGTGGWETSSWSVSAACTTGIFNFADMAVLAGCAVLLFSPSAKETRPVT